MFSIFQDPQGEIQIQADKDGLKWFIKNLKKAQKKTYHWTGYIPEKENKLEPIDADGVRNIEIFNISKMKKTFKKCSNKKLLTTEELRKNLNCREKNEQKN